MYNRRATTYIIRPLLTIFRVVFAGDVLFVKYLHNDGQREGSFLNEDITKCLDTCRNTNLYASTTVFITQGNM